MKLFFSLLLIFIFLVKSEKQIIVVYTDISCLNCFKNLKKSFSDNNINLTKIVYYGAEDYWKNKYTEENLKKIFGNKIKIEKTNQMNNTLKSPYIIVIDNKGVSQDTNLIHYEELFINGSLAVNRGKINELKK